MRIVHITIKDLTQILRDRMSLVFLLAMPLALTFFLGMAMSGDGAADAAADPRLALGWLSQDAAGLVSQQLHTDLLASDSLRLVELDATQDPAQLVRDGEVAAVLMVPPDFSKHALAGDAPQLSLAADELSMTGQSVLELVREPVIRVMSGVEIARITADLAGTDTDPTIQADAFRRAAQGWQTLLAGDPQVIVEQAQGALAQEGEGEDWLQGNPYNQTSPGLLVQFAIFSVISSAVILTQERKHRTLQRLITTNMQTWQIMTGHMLAMFVLVFAQQVVLVIFGQFALGVDYLREPVAILLVMLALSIWVACLAILVGVQAESDDQVVLYGMVAMFLFSALGGAWFPLEASGGAFAVIGRFTPTAWAMNGFQNVLLRGLAVNSVLVTVGVLLAWAAGFLGLAVWRLRAVDIQ